ncbi:prepilin-type N-terminal cleavage/methylation domain-containing protein [Pigmentiphaga sp. CHJ604]|uniref:prepilin-type N-terminal cleavage/methylation domain-containing protein n=1 Tax=Pigmentiphaga sp. CHJ604 TaxID=3081984 RepID=UPI0030D2014E
MINRSQTGFTVIELVVVLVVLSTLALLAMPLAELTVKRVKERELKQALVEIRQAIDAYKLAGGDKAKLAQTGGASGYPPTLMALVEGTPNAASTDGGVLYFLRRLPRDPFGDPKLGAEETWGLRSYASPHTDPEPGEDVYDVYSLSPGVGLNGIPYREW